MEANIFSDAEEEEYPFPVPFRGIKGKPEVSCGSISWISQTQVSLNIRPLLQ
jgi:hypothetical protein